MSQQTLIRNQAELSSLKKGGKFQKRKKRKGIRPRRVPTDADSESGLVVSQLSALKKSGNSEKEKNEKELGLVMSQQTVIRNQAELNSLKKRKKGVNPKKKKTKKN